VTEFYTRLSADSGHGDARALGPEVGVYAEAAVVAWTTKAAGSG